MRDHLELLICCSSDQASALPPALALTALPRHPDSSAPPHRTEAPRGDASQQTHTPAASASHITAIAWTNGTVHSGTTQLLTSSALAVASDAPTTTTVLPGHPSPSGIPKHWLSTFFYQKVSTEGWERLWSGSI